jgi:hypothetical protein
MKVDYRLRYSGIYGKGSKVPAAIYARIEEAVDGVINRPLKQVTPQNAVSFRPSFKINAKGGNEARGGMKRAGIVLYQKRGAIIRARGICSECRVSAPILWKYSKSNRGEVQICGTCRDRILPESFGGRDALDHSHVGGAFETNRRRH